MSFRFRLAFFLVAWTGTAVALDATDQGLYNVIHRYGHTTDTTFMAATSRLFVGFAAYRRGFERQHDAQL